jgi:hypothetical protein
LQQNPAKRFERFGIYLKNQRKGLISIRFDMGYIIWGIMGIDLSSRIF